MTEKLFVIRKGGYYYRPNAQGYTASLYEAGRYPEAEAMAHMEASDPGEITIFLAPLVSTTATLTPDIAAAAERIVLEHCVGSFDASNVGEGHMERLAAAIAAALEAERARNGTPAPQHNVVGDKPSIASLDERMIAAGMIPLSALLSGETPLKRWMAHTGVSDLLTFQDWLSRRYEEFMRMKVAYELGDKPKDDELYEWVLSHCGALGEVVANFRQMKERMANASPKQEAVEIKPLEWHGDDHVGYSAHAAGFGYYIEDESDKEACFILERHEGSSVMKSAHASLGDAQSHAQQHFDGVIRAAINASEVEG